MENQYIPIRRQISHALFVFSMIGFNTIYMNYGEEEISVKEKLSFIKLYLLPMICF